MSAARPLIFAYNFPNWHRDPKNEQRYGAGWTEWELLRSAPARFDGHRQPRVPAWGYFDETDPDYASRQIDTAKQYGVDGFFFDFYWYDDGPFLQRGLHATLDAPNASDIKVALMWANHNWVELFPAESADPPVINSGAVDRATFERMAEYLVSEVFTRPNYYCVDNRPWFSIYELGTFVKGMGGFEEAAGALQHLDQLAVRAGFDGVHVDALVWGFAVLPSAERTDDLASVIKKLSIRSATSYVWVHHADLAKFSFPQADIAELRREAYHEYERYAVDLPVPFYPNVTVGWDPSPRTSRVIEFQNRGYPWTTVFDGSPDEFELGLRAARDALARWAPPHPIVTINAWNEWTEGSYLLPDDVHQYAYLEAIRDVFGNQP